MPSPLVDQVARILATRARWSPLEYAFWLAALGSVFLLPGRHLILTEVAWLALFALSLDLILGYAGIISLGHAAFFGVGSYAAALFAKYGIITEPVLALVAAELPSTILREADCRQTVCRLVVDANDIAGMTMHGAMLANHLRVSFLREPWNDDIVAVVDRDTGATSGI